MARVERISPTEPIAVEQAQLIDPSAFPFSYAGAEALGQVGGVLFELGKRGLEAKNSLAVNAAVESRTLAKLKMQEFIKNNPDPDTWSKGAQGILEEQGKIFSQQRFNAETQKEQALEQQAFMDKLNMDVGIAAVTQNIENDIAVSGKNLIDVTADDDGTPEAAADILEQQELYQKALERKYTPEIAAIHMEETLREAKKAFYIDQSKLDPDAIIELMRKKKKALGKAGKDKEGLGAKDYDDITASAYSAQALANRSLNDQQEADRDKLGNALDDGSIDYAMIDRTSLDEKEQESYRIKMNTEVKRKADGVEIITDQARKAELLDMAAAIKWPDRQIDSQEVKKLAHEGRYGLDASLDDAAYDEIRDAIRRAEEDKMPFTQKFIETIIGELITGAPSSVLGLPLPTLRTREDAVRHATNAFGRFVNRVPGVMDTIDAKYSPEKRKSTPTEPKDNPAYDFDGELIGAYNPDGSITLNWEGTRRLWELSGRDAKKARDMALQNRYVIPLLKEE